jgi:tetratricopeptide (TPR) repeat protein
MEILKKLAAAITIISVCLTTATAQNDASLQKAFSDSYTQEYYKKYPEAIATLGKVHSVESYETNLRLGWLNYLNKSYTQSQAYYQKAVALKPYSIEAKLGLCKPLSAVENWDKVLEQYEEVLKIDPQNYTAGYWSGVIFYNRKKYDAAIRNFERLVNLYPFDYDVNHMLAWSYLNSGRNNEAKLLFNKALLIKPGDASALAGLGKIN